MGETNADIRIRQQTLYAKEKGKTIKPLCLNQNQKDAVRRITLGIQEVDEVVRAAAVEDVIHTLENGHPLNRIIADEHGETMGYIACEDSNPHEAYLKYLGTDYHAGRNLLREIPAFLDYATHQGYTKLSFHGWNPRLNRILERYGFEQTRTDGMADHRIGYYERTLRQKPYEKTIGHRQHSLEEEINKANTEYQHTMDTFSPEVRLKKEQYVSTSFQAVSRRLTDQKKIAYGELEQAILRLKLARHFQTEDTCDVNTLSDAIIESPRFLQTDKGSLHRLFEIHQQKTAMKIAEARKQRAQIGHSETFNPFENLLTTTSGKYYIARLLNMSHLEKESEYMRHCVGTSDSYINKIRRGEIEILSFRTIPRMNPTTHKLEGDSPVITIEYNLKTKVIEQMKKQDDELLSPNDPYFNDVIDALKQLRLTRTDTEELRDFFKISSSETDKIKVADYCVLTEHGVVPFRRFNPDEGIFVLKTGDMKITPEMAHEDSAKIIQIIEGITVKPDEIAQKPTEITGNTKIYIGKLFPNFFQLVPDNVKHIYTSFPEGKIKKEQLVIGGKPKAVLEKAVTTGDFHASDWALSMIRNNDFTTLPKPEDITTVSLKVGDFGFTDSPTTDQIFERAKTYGLELCPAEAGIYQRLKDTHQPLYEWYYMAMKQITDSDGRPRVFELAHHAGGFWLLGLWARPGDRWALDDGFVFRLRK